ncbi:MAG: M20/M25/M40 family metallo-hydrolase [Longimicrobiales bacterium]|nr:M20/M25/M40 family metallo-hydrolase [Longimicrobiales bacterium]
MTGSTPPIRLLSVLLLATTLPVLAPAATAAQGAGGAAVDPAVQADVDALLQATAVRRALERVEALDDWSLERTIELTQIPAPPFLEEVRGRRFGELLRELGADSVWTDAEGNVIGLRRGLRGGRTIALGGHLDTVFPEGTDVTVRQRGDTLFAPGVGDDTRGLVVVLTVLRALEEAGVETEDDLLFIGTVGEEGLGDLRGMKHLFREGADPIHAWIEVDGGGIDRVVNQGLGSVRYRAAFVGPGGHSWGAFGLANPAHALGRAVRHFQDAADTLTRRGPRTSYNVGRIGGGTSVNSIPFEAWMEVDMRSESPRSLGRIEAAFVAAMERAVAEENALRREGEPVRLQLEKIGDRPSGETPASEALVQRALATTRVFGEAPSLGIASTNSNIPIAAGVPAVTIGRGGEGGHGHAPEEYWVNRDGYLAIQRALLLTVAEARLAAILP